MQMKNETTGYPSIDKPWLKYFSKEAITQDFIECNIYEQIYINNKNKLSEFAINYFGRKITYSELFQNILKTEKAFYSIGVKKEDIVTITTVTTPELIYCFYALSKIGAIANIIDPRCHEDDFIEQIKETKSKVLVCIDVFNSKAINIAKKTDVDSIISISPADSLGGIKKFIYKITNNKNNLGIKIINWNSFIRKGKESQVQDNVVTSDMVALITHTSGTTGKAKGVMLTHKNINAVAFQYKLGLKHGRQQKYLAIIPPFIAFGICVAIHLPLSLGMICIPIPEFKVDKFYNYLKKYQPNHFTCTPANLEFLIKETRPIDLSFLCVPSVGGDYISEKLEMKINSFLSKHGCHVELIKGYGMTEVSSSACTTMEGYNKPESVGFPLIKMTISIFDPGTDKELKYGTQGEICFTGPNVMKGYYNNQIETEKIIKLHSDGQYWIHSGDIGYMDEEGFVYVIDRIKRIINLSNGIKLFPSKIERVIMRLAQVSSCAVIKHIIKENMITAQAFVVVKDAITEEKILRYCEENLPHEILPDRIKIIDQLPLTAVGKVDYSFLEEKYAK